MRLSVDMRGIRQDMELIGDQVHELNKLTIIAAESYESFAAGLQREIASTLKSRPQRADVDFFVGKRVLDESNGEYVLTEDDARKIHFQLIKTEIIDDKYKITNEGVEIIAQSKMPLPENLEPYRSSIGLLLKGIYTGEVFIPEDERQTVILQTNKNFEKKNSRNYGKN